MNGERDAYGDRKLSQRWPDWGWGWGWFLSSSDTSDRGGSAALSGSLMIPWLRTEPNLLITEMLGRVGFFFFFFLFSELSQEELLENHSRCEWDQLNYHKQQGHEEGRTHKPGPLLPQRSCHLPKAACRAWQRCQIDGRPQCHLMELLVPTGPQDAANDGYGSAWHELSSFSGPSTFHTLAPKWVLLCPFSRRGNRHSETLGNSLKATQLVKWRSWNRARSV